jgi:hypothetical protein
MAVSYNTQKKEIYIEDIGVTMRTMLAVAAKGQAECGVRRWHVVYKEVRIGMVSVKTETSRVRKFQKRSELTAECSPKQNPNTQVL